MCHVFSAYTSYRGLDEEQDIHVMEDLSGYPVDRRNSEMKWIDLIELHQKGCAMTCVKRVRIIL